MSDIYAGNVTLLLHCDGANGSTTFTDELGHSVTATGNAQVSTAQSMFGGASALFDGTGDYLSIADSPDWDLPGDFTVEFWFRQVTGGSAQGMLTVASYTTGFEIYLNSSNAPAVYDGGGQAILSGTAISTGTWYHLALVRSGTTLTLYIDGVSKGTATRSTSYTATSVTVGCGDPGTEYFNGYIDEVRITKGVARYLTGFTPPTAAFDLTAPPSGRPLVISSGGIREMASGTPVGVDNGGTGLSSPGPSGNCLESDGTKWVSGNTHAKLAASQSFSGGQIGTPYALSVSANAIAVDLALGNNFSVTLQATTGQTLSNPTNAVAGQSGQIAITQNATPSTLAFGSNWLNAASSSAAVVSTTASAVNVLSYYVVDSTHIWYVLNTHGVA